MQNDMELLRILLDGLSAEDREEVVPRLAPDLIVTTRRRVKRPYRRRAALSDGPSRRVDGR